MAPFIAYVAAMFLIALPAALFTKSRAAAAIFLVWGVGQLGYRIGAPEAIAQSCIYGVACALTWVSIARSPHHWPARDMVSAILFAPLLWLSLRYAAGSSNAYDWWWDIYWVAVTQLAFAARPVQLARLAKDWVNARRTKRGGDFLRTVF